MRQMPVAYEGTEPYIFISYAHKNSEMVIPAIKALQDAGYPVWYDAGIQVGSEWPEYIAEHLLNCSLVLAFISEASIASPNCRQEIVYALDKRKHMITVRLDDTQMSPGMEMQLNLCQGLLAYKHSSREGYINELVKAPYIAESLHMAHPHADFVGGGGEEPSNPESKESNGSSVKENVQRVLKKGAAWVKSFFDTKDTAFEYSAQDIEKNKGMSILCYLNLLILVPMFAAKDSGYVRFHMNQGLLLTLVWIAFGGVSWLLSVMTRGVLGFLAPIGNLLLLAVLVVSIVNVAKGRAKELPLIGKYRIFK